MPDTSKMTASEIFAMENGPRSTFMSIVPPPIDGIRALNPIKGGAAQLNQLDKRRSTTTLKHLRKSSIDAFADSLLDQAAQDGLHGPIYTSSLIDDAESPNLDDLVLDISSLELDGKQSEILAESVDGSSPSLSTKISLLERDLEGDTRSVVSDDIPFSDPDDGLSSAGVHTPILDLPADARLSVSSMLLHGGSMANARNTIKRMKKKLETALSEPTPEFDLQETELQYGEDATAF
ncbi:hypothetical protein BASA81_013955 [Batrachochytrium salamandrivorans]|nr:hypothetical protein BASA81_013955 [Batrachochytrium salamandrivorans]